MMCKEKDDNFAYDEDILNISERLTEMDCT